jgi:uncharacterized protein involved in exopolysaccharide biosynthesis
MVIVLLSDAPEGLAVNSRGFCLVSVESWSERTQKDAGARPAPARLKRLRTQLGLADALLSLWRFKWLMFLVFLPIALAGVAISLLFPAEYTASTRLLVRLGQEYVFEPVIGDAAKGAFPQQEELLQAESELANSPVIAERVIKTVGLKKLYPDLGRAADRAPAAKAYVIEQQALEAFAKHLHVGSSPKSSILRMTFAHEDPKLAAETLNAFVSAYLAYRSEVLAGGEVEGLTQQRGVIETRLADADKALRDFLAINAIGDFDVAMNSTAKLYSDISDKLSEVEASQREADAKARGLTRQLSSTPSEIPLYSESNSEQELFSLKAQRNDLLTRYRPDSRAVQDLDKRIAQMETFLKSTAPGGLKRVGQNPTWQAMEADRAKAQADAVALTARADELKRQRAEADNRRAQLASLEPQYRRLKRDRDALETSAAAFATREQTERSRTELAQRSVNNISVYEAARPPAKGSSPKRTIALALAAFGLLTALVVGLFRIWQLRTFPSTGSVERTLGLPVLAAARER